MIYYHKKYPPKEYLVRCNGQAIRCRLYKEMMLKVPVKPEEKVYSGYWDRLWNSSEEDPDEEVHYKRITVLYVQDTEKDTSVVFITEKDKAIIKSAMECGAYCVANYSSRNTTYRRACYRLFTENRYTGYHLSNTDEFDEEYFTVAFKALYGCFKRRSYLIAVQNLNDIKEQFADQDREEEEKKKAAKAKQEEQERLRNEEQERKRKQFLEKISEAKAKHSAGIIEEFYRLDLLNQLTLTNAEKVREYAAVREFCIRHIPDLDNRMFSLQILRADYQSYIDRSCLEAFASNWRELNRSYKALERGMRGEEKVLDVLRLFDDRIHILHGYTWGCEHDFVVLSPYGIFTIEVKSLRGEYVVTKTGLLKCISNPKVKTKDIAFQSKKHLETLRRNLGNCEVFSDEIPLHEIICSAEPSFTIADEYGYIPVCYYNTLDKLLLPSGEKVVLSEEQMLAIKRYLTEHWAPEFVFDVFLPRGEIDGRDDFIRSFADVASGYYVAHCLLSEDEQSPN